MSTFRKYNSIENSYREKFLNGANFSFVIGEQEMRFAKKTAFIKSDEEFFNYNIVVEKYKENVKALTDYIKSTKEGVKQVTIYGEIIGGNYPHADIKDNMKVSSVQNKVKVYYTPDIEFYAFDIMINAENYLSVDEANGLFERFDLFYAKTLFRGKLQECLDFEKEYVTKIPTMFGLPTIEGNIGEGNVIKPVESKFLFSGNRVIIKNKTAKFSEKKEGAPKVKVAIKLTSEAERLLSEMSCLVTENRVRNVISHHGDVTQKDFGVLMGKVNKDVIEDFMKDFKEGFIELSKKERQFITKDVGRQNAEILRVNFPSIIDGIF